MPTRRVLAIAAIALLAGAVVGAGAVYEGSPLDDALRALTGSDARVRIAVENTGTHVLEADLDLSEAGGDSLFNGALQIPPRETRSRTLVGHLSGEFLVLGEFSWAEAARQGNGDWAIPFRATDCARGETIVVTFVVDTSTGVEVDGDVRCAG